MTTEPEEAGDPARRKFDDVAQLFGSIVPPSGTTPRPMRPFRPLPTSLPAQPVPQIVPLPRSFDAPEEAPDEAAPQDAAPEPSVPAEPQPVEPPPTPPQTGRAAPVGKPPALVTPIRTEPPALASRRKRPTEIPWPDAFEPRPNFRTPKPRKWSWLLLIPAGLVAAVAVTMLDTRALRSWLDANVLHRSPVPATLQSPLLPAPFRNGPATNGPAMNGIVPPPVLDPAKVIQVPYPALPTSPVAVPPGTEVSPPPVDQTAAAATPAPIHVTIQFRRGMPGADGEARRLAALLQGTGGSVELRPSPSTARMPTIMYYNAADRASASALALVLANEAPKWTLQLGAAKNPPGSLDILMP